MGAGGSSPSGAGGAGGTTGAGVGAGGTAGTGGGSTGTAGSAGVTGGAGSVDAGGAGGTDAVAALDCGPMGTALESHGPPWNRLNYVIVADGYSQSELAPDGALDQHLEAAMAKRFSDPIGQPYLRYRNFINICVLRIPSTPICGSSRFGCCGDDASRLATCDTTAVNDAIRDSLPASLEIDFRAVVLNGSSWWNAGGTVMIWSGGNTDAPAAALHEGGHTYNGLVDEIDTCEQDRVAQDPTAGVNMSLTNGNSGGKWDAWVGYSQSPGTGRQGFFTCGSANWRSSSNSMMNSPFGSDPNTSYNAVSREKIIMDIWRVVGQPYDSVEPPAGPVTNPVALKVNVIDPAVISVDWSVDGNLTAPNGGRTFAVGAAGLTPGTHTITARAFDNAGADFVRQGPGTTFNRQYWGAGATGHSDKTVAWTVTIQ